MRPEEITEMIEQLRTGAINELRVQKEHFLDFRTVLSKQDDFKHFRGIAQQGGDVIFQYLEQPRS
ncbi:hypothetical protein [Bacillus subtilis]|uniref:hypothetical protein n=1 Tax=Bacillus subtilis TaxID=1423 RepID=UPI00059720DD|nr:hypothetical protein [Bacillus subtilis]KIN57386.1 hypothetical protein B4073_1391 [Bacillus subtilis]MBP3047914.1 hypothetical protein [Bacillus subtilis subsp. subtilis]MEC1264617.1 hypothetical protein [Bacillus subtilis]QAW10640.1 hypothetical protein ETA15_08210 [Bacillus subtilis]